MFLVMSPDGIIWFGVFGEAGTRSGRRRLEGRRRGARSQLDTISGQHVDG